MKAAYSLAVFLAYAATTAVGTGTSLRAHIQAKDAGIFTNRLTPNNDCAKACIAEATKNAPSLRETIDGLVDEASIDPIDWAKQGFSAAENTFLGPKEISDCFSAKQTIGSGILGALIPGTQMQTSSLGCIVGACNDKC